MQLHTFITRSAIQLFQQYTLTNTQKMSINMTTKHKMPATSTSLAQIHPQNSKIDQILRRLHIRKQELIESVRLINNNNKKGRAELSNNGENVGNGQNVKCQQQNGQLKRLQKYQDKIELQRQQISRLEQQHSQTQQKIIGYVEQIQQSEAKLKEISERVTKQYRQKLGIQSKTSETNKKYIYHLLYKLQQQLLHSPMSMRKILCKFYLQHNKIPQKCYNYQVPVCSLIDYVIKWKLVNKLFGAVINNHFYRANQRNNAVQKQQEQFHCFYTQEEIRSQESEVYSQEQHSQCEENVPNNRSVHDTWLQILKLMKALQKLEPIPTTIQQNQYEIQMNLGHFVGVSEVEKYAKKSVSQANQIKKNIKGIKVKMQQQIDKSTEIQQEIKMKEQLINCFKDKIIRIEADIAVKKKAMQEKAKQRINNYEKQLKQVQQAIKYFSIKKQTSNIENPQEPSSVNHLKSMCDFSTTTFLSPIKSTIQRANHLSPNSHVLNSTKRANYSNMKYSLRNLLSPNKNQTINKMDKKRAWK